MLKQKLHLSLCVRAAASERFLDITAVFFTTPAEAYDELLFRRTAKNLWIGGINVTARYLLVDDNPGKVEQS